MNFLEIAPNRYTINKCKYEYIISVYGGAVYLRDNLSILSIQETLFNKCITQSVFYFTDMNFGCPAYFHEGNMIFLTKVLISNCISKCRGIAASFVNHTYANLQQINDSSTISNILLSSECQICLCKGNTLISNNNNSLCESNFPGINSIYGSVDLHDVFSFYFNNSRAQTILRHNCLDISSNIIKHMILYKNVATQYICDITLARANFINCTFFENSVYSFGSNPLISNSFTDHELTGCQTDQVVIISNLQIKTQFGAKHLKFCPIQSCVQSIFLNLFNFLNLINFIVVSP